MNRNRIAWLAKGVEQSKRISIVFWKQPDLGSLTKPKIVLKFTFGWGLIISAFRSPGASNKNVPRNNSITDRQKEAENWETWCLTRRRSPKRIWTWERVNQNQIWGLLPLCEKYGPRKTWNSLVFLFASVTHTIQKPKVKWSAVVIGVYLTHKMYLCLFKRA